MKSLVQAYDAFIKALRQKDDAFVLYMSYPISSRTEAQWRDYERVVTHLHEKSIDLKNEIEKIR